MQICRAFRPRNSRATLYSLYNGARKTSSLAKEVEAYDVVCVGGGPAGLTLVNALGATPATSGLKVALVEAQDLSKTESLQRQTPSPPPSNRCSSLTPSSVDFLDSIGVWKHMNMSRIQPYSAMRVWDGLTDAQITFDLATANKSSSYTTGRKSAIAYMAENSNLVAALTTRARQLDNITLLDNNKVDSITLGHDSTEESYRSWPHLRLSSGRHVAARLVVGADGPNSLVRSYSGITSRGWPYERHGVVATVQLERKNNDKLLQPSAYQRFLPTGPIALLPLPGNMASIVWTTIPSRASLLKSLSATDMTAMINAAFRLSLPDLDYLHTISSGQSEEVRWREEHSKFDLSLVPDNIAGVISGSVASFPLRMLHADVYHGDRAVLIGDAAHTIHPLAGQGLNQGQADARELARSISRAVSQGDDIGSTLVLESYNAARYAANNLLLGTVDKLHKLYSVSSGPLVPLRSLGLSLVNAMGPVKTFLMQQAAQN